jgi:hypothetical protein
MRRRKAGIPVVLGIFLTGILLLPVPTSAGTILVPVSQTRSLSGNSYAEDMYGGPFSDSDFDQAVDFTPFHGAIAADASVDGAIGSGDGQQASSIIANGIVAAGSMFANAETWDFGASADASAENRMEVTFQVMAETDYHLQGQINAFDEALTEVSLRNAAQQELYGVVIFGPASAVDIDKSGTPLTVERLGNGNVRLLWSPSCRPADTDFGVYEGDLANPAGGLTPVTCSTSGVTQWDFVPAFDHSFYVVVPNNGASEGSYGGTGAGAERLPSLSACQVQVLAAPACP